jgi:hypothetical protein
MVSAIATGGHNGVPMLHTGDTLAALRAAVGADHIAEIPRFFRDDVIERWDRRRGRGR